MEIMSGNITKEPTYQEINDMVYLEMVLKETMRLYPSVPAVGRVTEKEYNISTCDLHLIYK